MKKYFGLLLALVVTALPCTVNAAAKLSIDNANCVDEGDYRTCKGVLITDTALPQAIVSFTEEGGAEIVVVSEGDGATISAQNENTYTFVLKDPTVTGEIDLFTVRYKKSGQADCKVKVSFNGNNVVVPTPDTPTDNKQTGSTLPYIALGVIALGAAGAYVATRNKAKMYKI